MSILRNLGEGALYLSPIAVGVGLLAVFGRDRNRTAANEYDLWAPHNDEPTAELAPRRHIADVAVVEHIRPAALTMTVDATGWQAKVEGARRRIRPAAAMTKPVTFAAWEPEPTGLDGPVPPIARAVLIDQAVPTLSDAAVRGIAEEWLHELGEAERAKAGTRLVLTGAFAFVAVA